MKRESKQLYLKFNKEKGEFSLMDDNKVFEIFITDLKEDVQEKLIEFLGGENGNYDIFPIATITKDDEDEADELST